MNLFYDSQNQDIFMKFISPFVLYYISYYKLSLYISFFFLYKYLFYIPTTYKIKKRFIPHKLNKRFHAKYF